MMTTGEKAIVCLTTVADRATAAALSETLVREKLAGCVSELAVASTFRWEGKVEREDERMLVIKTTPGAWPDLCDRIRELSTYDVPEILALETVAVEASYLGWLTRCVAPVSARR